MKVEEILSLALVALVGLLAVPRMRTHRWIVPLIYGTGQLLMAMSVLLTGLSAVFPSVPRQVLVFALKVLQTVDWNEINLSTPTMMGLGSLAILILLAPFAAWRESLNNVGRRTEWHNCAGHSNNGKRRTTQTTSGAASRPKPRQELQVLVEQMKRQKSI